MQKLILGDCLLSLKELPDNSVDSLVCDPPAGIGFMGKAWDGDKGGRRQWIAWLTEIMVEVKRVLKPGAHGFVWAIPRTSHWTATALEDAGFEVRDVCTHLFGTGFPKSHNGAHGGTALKPASEHWILIRKPLIGTVAKNFELYGVGGLNIDASRIVTTDKPKGSGQRKQDDVFKLGGSGNGGNETSPLGRWPANVLFDESAAEMLDEQSGALKSGGGTKTKAGGATSYKLTTKHYDAYDCQPDSGGASRFFYVAKSSKRDRNSDGAVVNNHPTCKPIKLMEYLIHMITPPGGTVLDPFLGSGTTLVAAKRLGFNGIGCEREPEYLAIAEKRIAHV